MDISLKEAAQFLQNADRVRILTHISPDGDTLGCAAALCLALQKVGKQAHFVCSDPIPQKYDFMLDCIPAQEFEPETVVAVDVADPKLLGSALAEWGKRVDLCIDHHFSNVRYAARSVVNSAAANCENIYLLIRLLNVEMDEPIARCLYTGLITDTGCFRYSCVTPQTHTIAADLMQYCRDTAAINLNMFEIKSRPRLALERLALDQMLFWHNDRCALIAVSQEMLRETGATDADLEGLAPITRNVEGVMIGFLIREKIDGSYKISCRTCEKINAAELCAKLGGGGHSRAAGCTFTGPLHDLLEILKTLTAEFLPQ